jgi:hypothetical protein
MNLSSLKPHAAALVFLVLVPAFLLPETTFQGLGLAQHDILQWRAAAEELRNGYFETGEQPLWANNMFGGMPAYVISNIRHLPSVDTALNGLGEAVYPYLYLLTLLLGGYVFLLGFGLSSAAALIGALAIGLTTYIPIIIGAGHNTKFHAYAFIPWMMIGFRMVLKDRYLPGLAVFALFFSLHVRAGHPQVTYYFLFLMGLWWLVESVADVRAGRSNAVAIRTGVLAAGTAIALMTVVPQYWALSEYSPYSIRGGSPLAGTTGLDQDYAFVWSQGWTELLTLLVPNLFGGGGALYWGPKPMTSGPHYLGAMTALFLLIALTGKKDRTDAVFLSAGALAMLFSLGNHFALLNDAMFAWFPGFDKFRTPEMWLMMTCFAWTVPAARAFDRDWSFRPVWFGGAAAVGLALVGWMAVSSGADFEKDGERMEIMRQIARENNVPADDPRVRQAASQFLASSKPEREDAAKADLLRFLVLAGAALGVMTGVIRKSLKKEHAAIALVLISAYDLISAGRRYIPESAFKPRGKDVADVLRAQTRGIDRWLAERTQTGEGWSYRVLPLSENPFNNAVPSFHYASLGGYSGAKLRNFQDVVDHALFTGPAGIHTGVLNMMNVKYITYNAPVAIPGFQTVHESEGIYVLENTAVLPKAWFADSVMTVDGPVAAMDAVISSLHDARSLAIVQTDAALASGPGGTAAIAAYGAHRIVIRTDRATDGFLVLGEIEYPAGWTASVDGVDTPILATNYLLRGVSVPAGQREVVFTFKPAWLGPAKTASLTAHLLILGLLIAAAVVTVRKP